MKTSLLFLFSVLSLFLIPDHLQAGTVDHRGTAADNPCYPPDWCSTGSITLSSANLYWESVYGANYYEVQYRYAGGYWITLSGYCYQTWINVYGLNACSGYEWRVRSYCSGGYYSPWSYINYFTTLCNACPKPYSTYTTDVTAYSANLHWSEVWGATEYVVQIRWPSGSWTTVPGTPCQANWITVGNLQPGTSYDWRVRVKCGYYTFSDWTYGWFGTPQYYSCHYPEWLQCYDITEYSATWKWENVYDAMYYHVQWRTPGGQWYDLPGGWQYGTWCWVNHLSPCTTYEWRVRNYCQYGGWSNWCTPYVFTTHCYNACQVPTGLITKDIGDHTATFKWSPVSGASSYTIQMKDAWGNWYEIPGSPTTGTWIIAKNLSSCKSYEWRIRSNCYYGSFSSWSTGKSFTTTCGNGCHAPEWVYTNGISAGSANLHWEPVSGADYYVVEYRKEGGNWSEVPGGTVTDAFYELTGLESVTTYQWRVKSHCATGVFSDFSPETYFKTLSADCGLPFFRYTTPITDSTATLNWTAVPGALNYTVQYRRVNEVWLDVPNSPTTATSITVSQLTPNTQYEWRMQVNCQNGGYSPWLSGIKFTTGNVIGCATPGGLVTEGISLNGAVLRWLAVADAQSYSVEIRLLPGGAWKQAPGSPVDTNFIVVDSLGPWMTYAWRVRTNCSNGAYSYFSSIAQFTTGSAPPCGPPAGLSAGAISETSATLSWTAVPGALGYKVQTRLPNLTWMDVGGLVSDTFKVVNGFSSNTTYEWRVGARCDSLHFSNWSPVKVFTTLGTNQLNDDCANAVLLTVHTSCEPVFASNVGATPSNPPPAGGCWVNGYRDVWFKFAMPDVTNPAVTIRTSAGSLGNAVMEVYSGTDCGVQSLIACEDNNDNGNGSSMPVINLTGTPNAAIWVRVWGFDGSTGTFTICVFNGISFNSAVMRDIESPVEGEIIGVPDEALAGTPDQPDQPEVKISPNPVSDQLRVEVRQTETSQVTALRMIDLSGKEIKTQRFEPGPVRRFNYDLDVTGLQPGMYVLLVQTTVSIITEKVMVVR